MLKRFCIKFTALLLAIMLTGVFPVLAESYVEYADSLSVYQLSRALTESRISFYVSIDGVWTLVATEDSLTQLSTGQYGASQEQVTAALADYGYESFNYRHFPYTVLNLTDSSSLGVYYNYSTVGVAMAYNNNTTNIYRICYCPGKADASDIVASTAAAEYAFWSINVEAVSDEAAAQVDYGSAVGGDERHLALNGSSVTVTVPKTAGTTWRYTASCPVVINEGTDTIAYTFDGVSGPISLTQSAPITVTVKTRGLDGNVTGAASYQLSAGGTLPADAISAVDSSLLWYTEDGAQITDIASRTFTEDTVVYAAPKGNYSGATANFYVYWNDEWQIVHQDDVLFGPNGANRYLVSAEQLETAYGAFGFSKDPFIGSGDYRFGQDYSHTTTVWSDTVPEQLGSSWAYPLGSASSSSSYNIYYLPHNTGVINGANRSTLGEANGFHTVHLTDTGTGLSLELILDDTVPFKTWLAQNATMHPTGWAAPLSYYDWYADNALAQSLSDTATPDDLQWIYASHKTVTFTLQDEDGNVLGTVDKIPMGMNIANWLEENDSLSLDGGDTVHHYTWKLPNDTAITNQTAMQNVTLIGAKKPVYTVTFVDHRPGTDETGGSFVNTSEEYTTIRVIQGDTIPQDFIARMRSNVVLEEKYAFVEWQYEGDDGYLVMDAATPIVRDTVVWADYTQEVYVRFWTSRDKDEQFPGAGTETQKVGEKYTAGVPSADAISDAAPSEGMRFRYWLDLNTGTVFNPETDIVKSRLDLYPVYERSVFEFVEDDGSRLAMVYDGNSLHYEADERDGYYYAGLGVTRADGTTLIIPNGTEISRDYLTANGVTVPEPVNGRYILNAEPIYKAQRRVVYHTGDDAQFIIFGAEDQDTYTVDVNDEVVLLGALDIINVTSPVGLALDGWATADDPDTVKFGPNESFTGDELDTLAPAGGEVHLYPVWAQQANTVAVTFDSAYPTGAVDANGSTLAHKTYTVYIREGSQPTMPTLAKAGMTTPSNTMSDGSQRYVLAGWARDRDGDLSNNPDTNSGDLYAQTYGTYTEGSQYVMSVTEPITFYAIWVDAQPAVEEGINAFFHIRLDGTLPQEPSQHEQSGYLPGSCSDDTGWKGRIRKQINVVNNVREVEANIMENGEPDIATILDALKQSTAYSTAFPQILEETVNVNTYGTEWWIDWYACKFSCGAHYHVDGRVRFADQVELNYHPNGGQNVPAGTTHKLNSDADVDYTPMPIRNNFTFIGWDEDPNAQVPDYPAPGLTFPGSLNQSQIHMDSDKLLYAIWKPVVLPIPMDENFRGQKYETTISGVETAPQNGRTYQFTIEAVSMPEGADPYAKRTVTCAADGSFSFPQIFVQIPGMYVFEVHEVIGDLPVQYDTSVYRLTINIVESDYGLGIAGYSFTKDNKVVSVTDNDLKNAIFRFVNRTDVRNVKAMKVWNDGDNQDGLRPASVEVTLLRRGDSVFSETAYLTAATGWETEWEGLDIKDLGTGEIYEYYIVETAVPQYTTTYTGDMNTGLTVTNAYKPKEADFPVVKLWDDFDNAAGLRPEKLVYTITGRTADGTVVYTETSPELTDPWSHVFTGLPVFHKGEHILYELTECDIPGYTPTIKAVAGGAGDGSSTFSITNVLTSVPVTVNKTVEGNAAYEDDSFAFTAVVRDAQGNVVTAVQPGEGYTVDADGTVRFTLTHGGTVTLPFLPLNGTVTLTEDSGTYTIVWPEGGTETDGGMAYPITAGLEISVKNRREVDIPTGVVMANEPWLLLVLLCGIGLAGLGRKRRCV